MASTHTPCGIELPQVFFDGPADMEHIRGFAIKAETLGYDSLWNHRGFHHAGAGDFAQLRRGDYHQAQIGDFGDFAAVAQSAAAG
jgi:hypothetical protein